MKILMIHHSGLLGGGTLSCFDIVSTLINKGHTVNLFLPDGSNKAKEIAKIKGINIITSPISPIIFGSYSGGSSLIKVLLKYLATLKYKKDWFDLIQNQNPDLVIFNSIVLSPMIRIVNILGIKSVLFVRETMKGKRNNRINRYIASNLNQSINQVSFLSNFDKKQWNLKINSVVIPDKIDLESFELKEPVLYVKKKLGLDDDVFHVLYAGGLSEIKGAEIILKAINNLMSSYNVKLHILGDLYSNMKSMTGINKFIYYKNIKYIDRLYKYVKENNMEDYVSFVGLQDQMNKWYLSCDVVIIPFTKAHQARSIYEAGVFKKPVIASYYANFEEYLVDNKSGFFFENKNVNDLSKKIEKLILNKDLCKELGQGNYELMEEYHNSKIVNPMIESFINNLSIV